jgi:hypothetical protein
MRPKFVYAVPDDEYPNGYFRTRSKAELISYFGDKYVSVINTWFKNSGCEFETMHKGRRVIRIEIPKMKSKDHLTK